MSCSYFAINEWVKPADDRFAWTPPAYMTPSAYIEKGAGTVRHQLLSRFSHSEERAYLGCEGRGACVRWSTDFHMFPKLKPPATFVALALLAEGAVQF